MSFSGLKSRHQHGCVLFWRLQGRICFHAHAGGWQIRCTQLQTGSPCLLAGWLSDEGHSQILDAGHPKIFLLHLQSWQRKVESFSCLLFCHISLTFSLHFLSPHCTIPHINHICKAPFLLHNGTYSRALGIRMWTPLRDHYSAYQSEQGNWVCSTLALTLQIACTSFHNASTPTAQEISLSFSHVLSACVG